MSFDLYNDLLGASYSVYITSDDTIGWAFPLSIEEVTAICDDRLDLRFLVRSKLPSPQPQFDDLRRIVGAGWQIRGTAHDAPTAHCIIIDRRLVYATVIDPPDYSDALHFIEELSKVEPICRMFDDLWVGAKTINSFVTLYDGLIRSCTPSFEHTITVGAKSFWDALIRRLAREPLLMHELTPRRFEELIAELLSRDGLDVTLTPATRDGGRDILARSPIFRNHLYLVECKKYNPDNPVDVSIVRQLYGVLMQQRATAAMLATTSKFTKPALDFRTPIEFQMDLKAFNEIKRWIERKMPTKE